MADTNRKGSKKAKAGWLQRNPDQQSQPRKKNPKKAPEKMLRPQSPASSLSMPTLSFLDDDEDFSRPFEAFSNKKPRSRSPELNTPMMTESQNAAIQMPLKHLQLHTPMMTESQNAAIQMPLKKPRKYKRYYTWYKNDGIDRDNIHAHQAEADTFFILSRKRPGCSDEGCKGCENAGTLCDACIFFLPQLSRICLFQMYGRFELQHLLDTNGSCVLCKQEGPQNQLCPDNIWTQTGELITKHEKFAEVARAVEARWEEMLSAGVATSADRYVVEKDLYGKTESTESEKTVQASQEDNAEIRRRTENTKQPKINEMLDIDCESSLKKTMVSSRFALPPRTSHSPDIESWILRACRETEIDAGDTRVLRTMTEFCKEKSPAPHVCRIEKLPHDHWLGESFNAMLAIKCGIVGDEQQGPIKVSVYNKTNRPTVIRKGAVLGMFVRENYLSD